MFPITASFCAQVINSLSSVTFRLEGTHIPIFFSASLLFRSARRLNWRKRITFFFFMSLGGIGNTASSILSETRNFHDRVSVRSFVSVRLSV